MLTSAQLTTLKNELINDPRGMGYAAYRAVADASSPGATSVDLQNLVRLVNTYSGNAADTVKRVDVSVADIYQSLDVQDYNPLPSNPTAAQLSAERRYLAWLSGLPAVGLRVRLQNDDQSLTPVGKNLDVMFPATATAPATINTRNRIIALMTRPGTRAEVLFGAGVVVTSSEIAAALVS